MTQAPPSLESLMAQVTDEFLDRQDRGECPGVEEYAERYPQIAAFIRQMFPTLAVVRAGDDHPALDRQDSPRRLGDFRILKEVGRGGMGVVYEAEQISLGRRVALKVLPFASALDKRQLQRFKTEAQAAGQLHHTHIVPVYFVGEDRGVHFYAMQFIDGRSVADLIAGLRTEAQPAGAGDPTRPRDALSTLRSERKPDYYRWAAEAGAQAADALDHAHAHEVVHRDVKPANLIRDHAGQIWVTDFGLAQVRTDVRLTATGDVVGTLRYMSPEQALTPARVDHRTDVYSLGVTLYELLTLTPAFPAEDRAELLRQIADREPPSARVTDRTIPAELDVIVRKAMAKEPDDRYGTAKELAADLRRFLDNLPILARRPTLWQHTRKWARRHRHIVATAVLGMFVALVAMVGATVMLLAKNKELERAIREKEAAETTARESAAKELQAAAQAKANAERAQENADRAQTNFAEYHAAMSRMLEGLRWRITFSDEDGRQARQSSREVLRLLTKLPDDLAREPEIRGLKSMALGITAFADFMLGDGKAAEPGFQEAETLVTGVIQADPTDPDYRHQAGVLFYYRGIAALLEGQTDAANTYWERALTELRAGLAAQPRHEECRFALTEVITKFDMARKKGARIRPRETVADALALLEGLHKDYPKQVQYHLHRALLQAELAERKGAKDPAAAATDLEAVLPELRAVAAENPAHAMSHRELARWADTLAKLCWKLNRKGETEDLFREALAAAQAVVTQLPNSANDQYALSQVSQSLAVVLGPSGPAADKAAEVIAIGVRALESAVFLEQGSAGYDSYRKKLFDLSLLQAKTLSHLGRPSEAMEAVGRAARVEAATDPKAGLLVAQSYALLAQKVMADPAIPQARREAAAEPYYQQALDGLRRATRRGQKDWEAVRQAPAFAGLKDRPEFQAITGGK